MCLIKCHGISKEVSVGTHKKYILKDINLVIEEAEYIAVIGHSGSGKSSLMNILGLIDVPTSGYLEICGHDSRELNDKYKSLLRNKYIGYVFQSFYLEPSYTVFQNVQMPLLINGTDKAQRNQKVSEALSKVGLLDKANQLSYTLSGGEQQRVSIARAIVNSPKILLADEPCGNLDSKNTKIIMDLLKSLNDSGKTVVLITHSPEDSKQANRHILLKDGMIVYDKNL